MDFIDTSVLVAAMVADEPHHDACRRLLGSGGCGMYAHGLAEAFSILTGGRKAFRLSPQVAASHLEDDFAPRLHVAALTPKEALHALRDCQSRGVQGGAIFDYLHLVTARKGRADRLYTLNVSNFQAFRRSGEPEIVHPYY